MSAALSASVVVAVGEAGRAVIPTLRSIFRSSAVPCEVVAVVAPAEEQRLRSVLTGAGLSSVHVVVAAGTSRAHQRNAGIAAVRGEVIGVIDAGDLVGTNWIAAACALIDAANDVIAHPKFIATFGRRSGWWPQPEDGAGRLLLPIAPAWSAPVFARREIWQRKPYPDTSDEVVDASWQADVAEIAHHSLVDRSVCFVRVWAAHAPWEPFGPKVASRSALLAHSDLAATVSLSAPLRTPLGRRVLAAKNAVLDIARPWVRGLRSLGLRRSAKLAPLWALDQWRAANSLEALVPFPRTDIAHWYERVAGATPHIERVARAYWWMLAAVGDAHVLYFAPWLRTGGGDTVLREYVRAVLRCAPGTRVALITTEPEPSTRLDELPRGVRVVEARDLLMRGISRDDLVERVIPALLTQLAPTTVHAINSTVGYDVTERVAHVLQPRTRFFLSTFSVDRQPDGERTSVLFLRPPKFLDDVSAVLVDSATFVDSAVRELGYPRERFRVIRSAIAMERYRGERPVGASLRVLWTGRFDVAKRLDLLVPILRSAREAGLKLELHFYGTEVMGDPGVADTLRDLAQLGAVRHPPYARFEELPIEDMDAYLLTSEWEGVPLSMLEAMAAGIPVVAPLVGGVGEVLNESTGYPVKRYDDADEYVGVLREMFEDYPMALRRAQNAHDEIVKSFSAEAFDRSLRDISGYLPG